MSERLGLSCKEVYYSSRLRFLAILLLVVFMQSKASAQLTTMGTDFWLTTVITSDILPDSNTMSWSWWELQITAPRQCTATIHYPFNHWDTTIVITPDTVTDFVATSVNVSRPISSNIISDKSIHLTSTDSIAVVLYAESNTSESSLILPIHALGHDYVVQTYPTCVISVHNRPTSSNFIVLATEDSTMVNITLGGATAAGNSAGDQLAVFLPHAGMTYQVASPRAGDLSGTRVTATNGKKFALFEGANAAVVPNDSTATYYNCHFEQAIPTNYWGRHFFAYSRPNLPHRVRVTSLNDNCNLFINNYYTTTLGALETYEYEIPDSTEFDYIVTSQPSCVGIYSPEVSTTQARSATNMLLMPPWEQASEATVTGILHPFTGSYYSSQKMHVIMRSDETGMLQIDSSDVASSFHTINANPSFSHACFSLPTGAHSLYTTEGEGFVAWVVDTLPHTYSGTHSAGAALRDMRNSLNVNETANANWLDTIPVCLGDTTRMWVESIYEIDSVRWLLGDGTTHYGDSISHLITQQGLFFITAVVYAACNGCYGQIDTLTSTLRVVGIDTLFRDTVGCEHSFMWMDSTFTIPDTIEYHFLDGNQCRCTLLLNVKNADPTSAIVNEIAECDSVFFNGLWYNMSDTIVLDTLTTTAGCDSVLLLKLTVNHSTQGYNTHIDFCDSLFFREEWHHSLDTVATDTLTSASGCDSVCFVTLIPHHSFEQTVDLYITENDTLEWIDGNFYSDTSAQPFVILQSKDGCDSIVRLRLHFIPTIITQEDTSVLWIPNAFTPGEETNNVFRVYSNGVSEIKVSVFNRWGLRVCTFDGLTEGWDGTCQGKDCQIGTYVYLITFRSASTPELPRQKKGTVLLIR